MKTLKKALALIMSLAILCSIPITASAAPVPEATIDTTKTGSLSLFKYDLTSAEKDGIWDSSYVSTGVKDEDGVESILGDPSRVSSLNANGTAYGYAVPGVEFTYLKVADIHRRLRISIPIPRLRKAPLRRSCSMGSNLRRKATSSSPFSVLRRRIGISPRMRLPAASLCIITSRTS